MQIQKKAPTVEACKRLDFQCGEYRNRTDDLLTASQIIYICDDLQKFVKYRKTVIYNYGTLCKFVKFIVFL